MDEKEAEAKLKVVAPHLCNKANVDELVKIGERAKKVLVGLEVLRDGNQKRELVEAGIDLFTQYRFNQLIEWSEGKDLDAIKEWARNMTMIHHSDSGGKFVVRDQSIIRLSTYLYAPGDHKTYRENLIIGCGTNPSYDDRDCTKIHPADTFTTLDYVKDTKPQITADITHDLSDIRAKFKFICFENIDKSVFDRPETMVYQNIKRLLDSNGVCVVASPVGTLKCEGLNVFKVGEGMFILTNKADTTITISKEVEIYIKNKFGDDLVKHLASLESLRSLSHEGDGIKPGGGGAAP